MTDNQWRDLGRGTGKRPEGLSDAAVVRCSPNRYDWHTAVASQFNWHPDLEYQVLEPTPTADKGGIWYEHKLQQSVETNDHDRFIFTWFNDAYPDAMADCLKAFRERRSALAADRAEVLREALQAVHDDLVMRASMKRSPDKTVDVGVSVWCKIVDALATPTGDAEHG